MRAAEAQRSYRTIRARRLTHAQPSVRETAASLSDWLSAPLPASAAPLSDYLLDATTRGYIAYISILS